MGRPFPTIDEFNPSPRLHDPKQMVFWNVEALDGHRSFRALYQGSSVADVFRSSWAGKLMEDVIPEPVRAFSLGAAHECAEKGCAVFTTLTTEDARGQDISCERLLLPLGRDGIVSQVVASLQLISLTGKFERKTVLASFERRSHVAAAARIQFRPTLTSAKVSLPEHA